jgi:hypothetical protein
MNPERKQWRTSLATMIRLNDVGMRTAEWTVYPPKFTMYEDCTYIYARFRDRWGNPWIFEQPISNELIEDVEMFPAFGALLLVIWDMFRQTMSRRYDDPLAFWPRMYPGRWTKPADQVGIPE